MNVVVSGAGDVGRYVASYFAARGSHVALVDRSPAVSAEAALQVGPTITVVTGDSCAVDVLRRAGALGADLVVAVTGDDEDNLVIGLLAKQEFGVSRVVGRVNNPRNEWLFTDMWGIDVSISAPNFLAGLTGDGDAQNHFVPLLVGIDESAHVCELTLLDSSPSVGSSIGSIDLGRCSLIGIVRKGVSRVADPALVLQVGDQVVFASDGAHDDDDRDARRLLIG
jgi:trk system potassium uptake protein